MIEPRPYQLQALEAIQEARTRGITRQLLSLPTGTGKTVIFSLLAKEHNDRTLIVCNSQELIGQAVDKLRIVIGPNVDFGVVQAEHDEVHARFVICSIQTACRERRLKKLKEQNFSLLIVDEAHHSVGSSYRTVIEELGFMNDDPNKLLVGMTATPRRADGIGLGSIFQEIVFDCSINTMIRSGYLSPLVGKQVFTKVELSSIAIQHGDFAIGELSNIVNTPARNQLIVDKFKEFASDRKKSLSFCADVKHAQDLAAAFNGNGIVTRAVYGALPKDERRQILNDFAEGKIKVLTNCALLCEGYDQADVDCILLGRPTKSSGLYTQQIGRGTRLHPLKRDCLILDFVDNSSRHSLCNFKNTLAGAEIQLLDQEEETEVEEGIIASEDEIVDSTTINALRAFSDRIEDIAFFDKAQFAWVPIGDAWHLKLAANRDVWVRKNEGGYLIVAHSNGEAISLSNRPLPLDYALGVAEDWARKQTTKGGWAYKNATWRSEPPTQKQLETLTKLGFSLDYGLTKGQASQLIDSKLGQKLSEPATIKQICWLKHHGIEVKNGITKVEAKKLIASTISK